MQVNMLEAKSQLSRLVKAAQAGEEVIIANHGVPAVRLTAIGQTEATRSLAEDMASLRDLLLQQETELTLPPRSDRTNPFTADDVAD
jgi:prevent-host-death family protein